MSERGTEGGKGSLAGRGQKASPVSKATLTRDKDVVFVGRAKEGTEIEFGGHVRRGCEPMDALFASLAGCMGIDAVLLHQKRKIEPESCNID